MSEVAAGEVLLSSEDIASRVEELGRRISEDYQGKDLILIGVLNGSFVFLADLARNISIPVWVQFISASSYGDSTESSGKVEVCRHQNHDIMKGKHVLIVEDIVDTGWTLSVGGLKENLVEEGAESVRACVLLDKPARRKADVELEYVGFVIPDAFVVGYGLDYCGLFRNLPDIRILDNQ